MPVHNRHTHELLLCRILLRTCYACPTHSLRMPYEVVTIVVRKNYITLRLRYDTIRNLFFDSYRILFIHNFWHDYIGPQEKHVAFNILNQYFSKYKMCVNGRFSKIQSHTHTHTYIYKNKSHNKVNSCMHIQCMYTLRT